MATIIDVCGNNMADGKKHRPDGDLQLPMYPFVKYKGWSFFPWPCLQKDAEKHFEKMKNFTARDDDILLCTAQKAGTHWIWEIVVMLMEHTTEYNVREGSFQIHLEYQEDYGILEKETRRRYLHSHLPFSFLPREHMEKKCKIVVMNRNPKDRHVSQYHFLKEMNGVPPDYSWDDYFQECILNDTLNTGWFNYTREMTAAAQKYENVHLVQFEDLKLNGVETIKRLADFLEVPYDDDFIAEVDNKCSFNNLKEHKVDVSVAVAKDFKSTVFRKGTIGDWKNYFTVAQNEQFGDIYKKEMEGVDIEFIYELPK